MVIWVRKWIRIIVSVPQVAVLRTGKSCSLQVPSIHASCCVAPEERVRCLCAMPGGE